MTIAFGALLCGGLCSWDGPKLWENIVIAGISLGTAWLVHFEAGSAKSGPVHNERAFYIDYYVDIRASLLGARALLIDKIFLRLLDEPFLDILDQCNIVQQCHAFLLLVALFGDPTHES